MGIRIISGKYKGRWIKTPSSRSVRPTTSVLREALFNICQSYVEKATFLDLFAGSGAIGIEALSRGASFVIFVEKDKKHLHLIEENLLELQIAKEYYQLIKSDALVAIEKISQKCDLVYIDPPYEEERNASSLIKQVFEKLIDFKCLKKKAFIFIEVPYEKNKEEKYQFPLLDLISSRKFGKSLLMQYQYL